MSLIKRPNSNNWYYRFQIQGRKYFGSTGTPKKSLAARIEAKRREETVSRLLGEVKPITLEEALERYKRSKEGTANYKNIVGYSNKLLGFKLEPKTGHRIEVTRLAPAEAYLHEITNKDIKALVTARKGEKTGSWTIKHELQTLRGAIHLARDLGHHVNIDVNWPTKDLKTKRGRLRFLTKEEELRLLAELDPNRSGRGLAPVEERQPERLNQMLYLYFRLSIQTVDLVANDSGGAVAQLFLLRYPQRVRTMLLTNCDVEPDSPPPALKPVIDMSREGTFCDQWLAPWVADKALARSETGLGGLTYTYPHDLTDETIDFYLAPLVSSPERKAQVHAYALGLDPNPLAGIEVELKRSQVPARIVWGTGDTIFSKDSPGYLDRILPNSRGVRSIPGAKLFFPEEFPDVIAEEARRLWGV